MSRKLTSPSKETCGPTGWNNGASVGVLAHALVTKYHRSPSFSLLDHTIDRLLRRNGITERRPGDELADQTPVLARQQNAIAGRSDGVKIFPAGETLDTHRWM